jgi:hypothetical protein
MFGMMAGWAQRSLFSTAHSLKAGEKLRLRYGLYVHAGIPPISAIEARWNEFAGWGD